MLETSNKQPLFLVVVNIVTGQLGVSDCDAGVGCELCWKGRSFKTQFSYGTNLPVLKPHSFCPIKG